MRFEWLNRKCAGNSGLLFVLICLLPACQEVSQDYAAEPSVDASPLTEAALPPVGPLREAAQKLEAGDAKAVARDLGSLQPETALDKAWHRLLLGQAWYEMGVHEKALRLLQANYEELRDARPMPDVPLTRVLAASLKGLGTYYRERQDVVQAYALHQLQWLYVKRLGSLKDRHEALISLDIDAALLRNFYASEQWLREALQIALQMPEGAERQKSLIITWNNLSISLQEVLRFTEAEAAVRESRRLAKIYDAGNEHREFREVWALAQGADVLSAWGQYAETKTPKEARPIYIRAQGSAVEAVMLAEQQGLDGEDRVILEQRMRKHCGNSCRPANPPKDP